MRKTTAAMFSVFLMVLSLAAGRMVLAQSNNEEPATLPVPAHIIIVIEENHGYSEIIGSPSAPYINSLASQGASFTNIHGETHPSQPNYLALYSGSEQGIIDDSCPHTFTAESLGGELIKAGLTFVGYGESLPKAGSTVCTSGEYARKHNPYVDFTDTPATDNLPFTSFPTSTNYGKLPTVAWVIPNLADDMHDGTIQQGDTWLKTNLSAYVTWAQTNNSLLVVTWDEDQGTTGNQIPTIFVGPMVKPGKYAEKINHYNILRTIEAMYGLPYLGNAATAITITNVWQ
jgi:phosphatidylinositol-3-phosphatase